jgi:hypothetical protein
LVVNRVAHLRAARWKTVPAGPGVYWWYFPEESIEKFRVGEFCRVASLVLRRSPTGKICLYHGMARSLSQRVAWHAEQALRISALKSGFLSTFRFTLLALTDFDYSAGAGAIDAFMDELDIEWETFPTPEEATAAERRELHGGTHFPLNIQNNYKPELAVYTRHLKASRKAYKARYLASEP